MQLTEFSFVSEGDKLHHADLGRVTLVAAEPDSLGRYVVLDRRGIYQLTIAQKLSRKAATS